MAESYAAINKLTGFPLIDEALDLKKQMEGRAFRPMFKPQIPFEETGKAKALEAKAMQPKVLKDPVEKHYYKAITGECPCTAVGGQPCDDCERKTRSNDYKTIQHDEGCPCPACYKPETISIKTGLPSLDEALANIPKYSLILVGGKTGSGKSALCKSIFGKTARSTWLKPGQPIPTSGRGDLGLIYDGDNFSFDFEAIRKGLQKRQFPWCVAMIPTRTTPYGGVVTSMGTSRPMYLASYAFSINKITTPGIENMGFIKQVKSRTHPKSNSPVFFTYEEHGLAQHNGRF